jgi:mannose-1-phosphate guanylyltransferase
VQINCKNQLNFSFILGVPPVMQGGRRNWTLTKSISYQRHFHRDEVWTFVEGTGILVIDGKMKEVQQGDVVYIRKGQKHAVKALTDLHFVEVQMGDRLVEEDIERFEWNWQG